MTADDDLRRAIGNVENWLEKALGIRADEVEGWPLVKATALAARSEARADGLEGTVLVTEETLAAALTAGGDTPLEAAMEAAAILRHLREGT